MTSVEPKDTRKSGKGVAVLAGFLFLGFFLLLSTVSFLSYKVVLNKYPVSSDKTKVDFAAAFKDFVDLFEDSKSDPKLDPHYRVSNTVVHESTSTVKLPIKIVTPSQRPVPTEPKIPTPTCYRYRIYEGEFKSDKCYTQEDYEGLNYYINAYNYAVWDGNTAQRGIDFTCDSNRDQFNLDYLEKVCKSYKEQKKKAIEKIEECSNKIKYLVSKGW